MSSSNINPLNSPSITAAVSILDNTKTVNSYSFNQVDVSAAKTFVRLNYTPLNLTSLRDELIGKNLLDAYATALKTMREHRRTPSVTDFSYLDSLLNANLSAENKQKLLEELQFYASAYKGKIPVNEKLLAVLDQALNPAPVAEIPAAVAPTVVATERVATPVIQSEAADPEEQTDPTPPQPLVERTIEPFTAPTLTLEATEVSEAYVPPFAEFDEEDAKVSPQASEQTVGQDDSSSQAELVVSADASNVQAPLPEQNVDAVSEPTSEEVVRPFDLTDSLGEEGSLANINWKQVATKTAIVTAWMVPPVLLLSAGYVAANTDEQVYDDFVDQIRSTAQSGVDQLNSAAQSASDYLSSTAQSAADYVSSTAQSGVDQLNSLAQSAADQISSTMQSVAEHLPNVGPLLNPMRPAREDLVNATASSGLVERVTDWTGATAQVVGSAVAGFAGHVASSFSSWGSQAASSTAAQMVPSAQNGTTLEECSMSDRPFGLNARDVVKEKADNALNAYRRGYETVEGVLSAVKTGVVNTVSGVVSQFSTKAASADQLAAPIAESLPIEAVVPTIPSDYAQQVAAQGTQDLLEAIIGPHPLADQLAASAAQALLSGNSSAYAEQVSHILNITNNLSMGVASVVTGAAVTTVGHTAGSAVAGSATSVSTAPQSFREVLEQRVQSPNNITAPVVSAQNATNSASGVVSLTNSSSTNSVSLTVPGSSPYYLKLKAAKDAAVQAAQVAAQNAVQNGHQQTFEEWQEQRIKFTTVQPPKPQLSSTQPVAEGTQQTFVFPNGDKEVRTFTGGSWRLDASSVATGPKPAEAAAEIPQTVYNMGMAVVNSVIGKVSSTFESIFGIKPSLESLMQDPAGFLSTATSNAFSNVVTSIKNSLPEFVSDASVALAPSTVPNMQAALPTPQQVVIPQQPPVVSNQTVGSNVANTTAPLNQTVQAAPQPAAMPQANVFNQTLAECAPRPAQPSLPTCAIENAPSQSPVIPNPFRQEVELLTGTCPAKTESWFTLSTVAKVFAGAVGLKVVGRVFRENRGANNQSLDPVALKAKEREYRRSLYDKKYFTHIFSRRQADLLDGDVANINDEVETYVERYNVYDRQVKEEQRKVQEEQRKLESQEQETLRIRDLKRNALEQIDATIEDRDYQVSEILGICQDALPPHLRNRIGTGWVDSKRREAGIGGKWEVVRGKPKWVDPKVAVPGSQLRGWIKPFVNEYYIDPELIPGF